MQDHRAALGKTGEDDAPRIDALIALRLDQAHDTFRGGFQLRTIDGPRRAHGQDVVPAGHGPATIDGHRAGRCLGQDKAAARQVPLQQLGNRLEVVLIGTQAVQPDHAGIGCLARF